MNFNTVSARELSYDMKYKLGVSSNAKETVLAHDMPLYEAVHRPKRNTSLR